MTELSPRAWAWLEERAWTRGGRRSSREELRQLLPSIEPKLLDAVWWFEERHGDFACDLQGHALELGVARLRARGIEPRAVRHGSLVLVGVERGGELWIDARGILWLSRPGRDRGELATNIFKYIERLAAMSERSKSAYVVHVSPQAHEIATTLGLTKDEVVSEPLYLLAAGSGIMLDAALCGTPSRTKSATLVIADYATLTATLRTLAGKIPGFRANLAPGQPSTVVKRIDRALAPGLATFEVALTQNPTVRIPTLDDGALFIAEDSRMITMLSLDDDGELRTMLALGPDHGLWTDYVLPWPTVP